MTAAGDVGALVLLSFAIPFVILAAGTPVVLVLMAVLWLLRIL